MHGNQLYYSFEMNIQNGMTSKKREEKQFVYNMVIYYQLFNLCE